MNFNTTSKLCVLFDVNYGCEKLYLRPATTRGVASIRITGVPWAIATARYALSICVSATGFTRPDKQVLALASHRASSKAKGDVGSVSYSSSNVQAHCNVMILTI